MKNPRIKLTLSFLILMFSCIAQESETRWEIKKESTAYGLTLAYSLPEDQLQQIVGDKFKPILNKVGNGFLMLFISTSKHYNLDSTSYDNLQIAHILISVEGALNNPLVITGENQKIYEVFTTYNFKPDIGEIKLLVEYKGDSILTNAEIITQEGSIKIEAKFLNNPGELKTIESAKINAKADSKSFFMGNESYRSVQIYSAVIENEGKNWITQLNLPSKPDKIWLNVDFSWDFVFTLE